MKRILSLLFLIMTVLNGYTQNPFASYGYQPKMGTMSNGRYDECHDKSRIVEIGSILFDTETNKIVGRVEKDTVATDMEAQTVSMFISIDPHAEKYYSISPYAYCMNNPIRYIDPDGKDGWDVVVGYGIGIITNIIPRSGGIRDSYEPNDPSDYNDALQGTDYASTLIGSGLIKGGGTGMALGTAAITVGSTATVASGGTLAIGGVPVAGVRVTLIKAGGTSVIAGSVLMANGKQNQAAGYDRGKKEVTQLKTMNQLQKETNKGLTPNGIKRFDSGRGYKEQDHVHFKDNKNSALNKDGTWKHGNYKLNKEQKEYLKQNG